MRPKDRPPGPVYGRGVLDPAPQPIEVSRDVLAGQEPTSTLLSHSVVPPYRLAVGPRRHRPPATARDVPRYRSPLASRSSRRATQLPPNSLASQSSFQLPLIQRRGVPLAPWTSLAGIPSSPANTNIERLHT